MDILKYKGYEGTVDVDMTEGICRGKILFINDLVTYKAVTPKTLQAEFEASVDDYLETCVILGREAQKPLKGVFNVRITPALHKSATIRAMSDETSLNDIVAKAIDSYVNTHQERPQPDGAAFVSGFKVGLGEQAYFSNKEISPRKYDKTYSKTSSKKKEVQYRGH